MAERDGVESLIEHTQDVITVLDEDGVIQYASPSIATVLGHRPEDVVGLNVFEQVHRDDREATVTAFERAIRTGEREEIQHRFVTADGSWRWLESVADGVYNDRHGGYVVTGRDITDRRRALREQRRTRERLEELTDRSRDVLWMFAADWSELLFVNRAYEEIYGGDVDELYVDPSSFLEYIHPEDRDDVLAAMERLSAGDAVGLEYRVNPDEDYGRWVWVQGRPVVEDGRVVRVVGFSRDVTERVRYRRQLRVMDRVLRHNLHNDMNVVLGYAEQAQETCDGACSEALDAVVDRGRALLDTVAKQRDIVELLDPVPDRGDLDIARAVRAVAADVRERYPEATVSVETPDRVQVRALPEIELGVRELIENAVKHTDDPAPTATVTVREDGDRVALSVADEGPGIPDQEIAVLTGDREVEPLFHGSGLGLWLVNLVVRRSDGDLAFAPNEPRGSRVSISLDRVPE